MSAVCGTRTFGRAPSINFHKIDSRVALPVCIRYGIERTSSDHSTTHASNYAVRGTYNSDAIQAEHAQQIFDIPRYVVTSLRAEDEKVREAPRNLTCFL